ISRFLKARLDRSPGAGLEPRAQPQRGRDGFQFRLHDLDYCILIEIELVLRLVVHGFWSSFSTSLQQAKTGGDFDHATTDYFKVFETDVPNPDFHRLAERTGYSAGLQGAQPRPRRAPA